MEVFCFFLLRLSASSRLRRTKSKTSPVVHSGTSPC